MPNPPLTRDAIIAEARTWINTPIHHQGRLKGVGVDCVGFGVGVFRALGCTVQDRIDYPEYPQGDSLLQALEAYLDRVQVTDALPGDILVFKNPKGEAQHVGFASDKGVIHAYFAVRKVVEHRLDDRWQRRIVAAYRYPEVTG